MITRCLFFFLSLISCVAFSQAPHLLFDQLTIEDGISNINCILKDKMNFLWFGSTHGLYRFDGCNFRAFVNNPEDRFSLSSDNVTCLYEDTQGYLWVGTLNGGLNRYDPLTESFNAYRNSTDEKSISSDYVTSIAQAGNTLWIGTTAGLNLLDPVKNKFRRLIHQEGNPKSINANEVFSILKDKEGKIWVTTDKGILDLFDPRDSSFQHFVYNNVAYHSGKNGQRIMQDYLGYFWIGTEGEGLYRFDERAKKFKHYFSSAAAGCLSSNIITDIKEGQVGELWITTDGGGLNHLDLSSEQFVSYKHDRQNSKSVSNNSSYSLYIGDHQSLWLGMGDGVVNVSVSTPFTTYLPSLIHKENGIGFQVVVALLMDSNNKLWVGTGGGGLDEFDLDKKIFRNYRHQQSNPSSIASDIILSLHEDRNRNLWVGTYLGGIDLLNRSTGKFRNLKHHQKNSNSLTHDHVFEIKDDADGIIWIATHGGGLDQYNKSTGQFIHYRHDPKNPLSLGSDKVLCLLNDHNNKLWVGTLDGGLQQFDKEKKIFVSKELTTTSSNHANKSPVHVIFQDYDENIWIGTGGSGLFCLNHESGRLELYRIKNGLPSNSIYGILQDDFGNLWITTNKGLAKLNRKTKRITSYTMADGLPTNDFESGAMVISREGEIFIGSKKGLVSFFPSSLAENKENVVVTFTGFRVFHKPVSPGEIVDDVIPLPQSIQYTKQLILPFSLNSFSIEFAAPGFSIPTKIKYKYKLEGVDKGWTEIQKNECVASYSNLKEGNYAFKVVAANSEGVWGTQEAVVKIVIEPPLSRTMMAYLSYCVGILISCYFIFREISRRTKLKIELISEKQKHDSDNAVYLSKIGLFTNISHELRTPLTLIKGPLEKLLKSIVPGETGHELSLMKRNVDRLLTLVNQLLDFRKMETGMMKLQVSQSDVAELIRTTLIPFHELATSIPVHFTIDYEPHENEIWFDRSKIEIIITNLVGNAFKFVNKGGEIAVHISVSSTLDNDLLILKVTNSGEEISAEDLPFIFEPFFQGTSGSNRINKGTGIGLSLTKSLVDLHHGTIEVSSKKNEGTRFTVILPANQDAYLAEEILNTSPNPVEEEVYLNGFTLTENEQAVNEQDYVAGTPTILIVEDHNELRNFIVQGFQYEFKTVQADNGEEALTKAMAILPDLIISDVMMPKLSGLELCEKLKKNENTCHIPVILLTARVDVAHQYEGLQCGADDYISKPFNFDLLSARVANLLNSRKKLQARFIRELILKSSEVVINIPDQKFVNDMHAILERHLDNPKFSVSQLCKEIGVSRTVLYRKTMALANKPPNDFIRAFRLHRASQLLNDSTLSINEISTMVGFDSPKYFSTCFKTEFGVSPSEYLLSESKTVQASISLTPKDPLP